MDTDVVADLKHFIGGAFSGVQSQFMAHSQHLQGITKQLNTYEQHLSQIKKRLDSHSQRFTRIEEQLQGYNQHFTQVEKRLDSHCQHFTRLEQRIDQLETSMSLHFHELSVAIADALDDTHEVTQSQHDNHEIRIRRLEQKRA